MSSKDNNNEHLSAEKKQDLNNFTSFFKGLFAGLVVASINKHLILGGIAGIVGGIYYQQEYGHPDVVALINENCKKFGLKGIPVDNNKKE